MSSKRTLVLGSAVVAATFSLLWIAQPGKGGAATSGSRSKWVEARSGAAQGGAGAVHAPVANPKSKTVKPLFAEVGRPDYADQIEACFPRGHGEPNWVRFDREQLAGKESPLWQPKGEGEYTLPLPGGRTVQVSVSSSEMLDASRFVSEGAIKGQPGSRVILSGNEQGQYSMEISEAVGLGDSELPKGGSRRYVGRATGGDTMALFRIDPSQGGSCGGDLVVPEALRTAAASRVASQSVASTTSPSSTGENPVLAASVVSAIQVDVLFAYSSSVANTFTGTSAQKLAALQSHVDSIVASVNSDCARSLVNMKIRSVGLVPVTYDEWSGAASGTNSRALTALADIDDGQMDELHAQRDSLGADLVCLMLNRNDSSGTGLTIGIAYKPTTPSLKDPSPGLYNDMTGFSVVTFAYTLGYNLVSHELGHNFGAAHDREHAYGYDEDGNQIVSEGAWPFSFGYRFTGIFGSLHHTIMSYEPGEGVSYFSNPYITAPELYLRVKVGVEEGKDGQAYNAKTLNETSFEISQYRKQTTDPVAAGTMVNVSTLGFVGRDENQLTAGFAIEGTGSKEVMIRAAGPSLAQFGVGNFVSDPWIQLVSIEEKAVKAEVDNWVAQPNAARISTVTTDLKAFSLTSDKDAALVMNLEPGMYTAKVEGVGGETGVGIVEVYETPDAGSAKLVNVSTRGYATQATPLTGGFVVSGAAGTTKRILIRAQGPNLTTYGIKAPMVDPQIALFRTDGGAKKLFVNDDWAFGTPENPLAATEYSKAIVATGFAPKNRREACILVDLEPGMYTAEVTPFSDETYPEEPGVAIIEVFEITK